MGLKPIVFETPTEIECLGNYMKSETHIFLNLFKSVHQATGSTISITGQVAPSATAKDNGRGALARKKLNFTIRAWTGPPINPTTKLVQMIAFTWGFWKMFLPLCSLIETAGTNILLHARWAASYKMEMVILNLFLIEKGEPKMEKCTKPNCLDISREKMLAFIFNV